MLSTVLVDFLPIFWHLRRCAEFLARRRFEVFHAERYVAEVFAIFVLPNKSLIHYTRIQF